MGDGSKAFVKGGFGCLLAFIGLGVVIAVLGGRVRIDCGGALLLFGIGGVIGLVMLAVYKKGVREGRGQADDEEPAPEISYSEPDRWWCRDCGSTNAPEAKICQRCHAARPITPT